MTANPDVLQAFDRLAAILRQEGGVDAAPAKARRGFGSSALKTGGKIFAMVAQDTLVLKLPATRVDELIGAGRGARFDPGHGRAMKEWIALSVPENAWLELAREARAFVGSARS